MDNTRHVENGLAREQLQNRYGYQLGGKGEGKLLQFYCFLCFLITAIAYF